MFCTLANISLDFLRFFAGKLLFTNSQIVYYSVRVHFAFIQSEETSERKEKKITLAFSHYFLVFVVAASLHRFV